MNNTIIFIIIGILSGIINGLTGLGHAGAILIGLTLSGVINSYDTMVGTALYSQLFPVVAFGVWEFYKRKQIDYYAGNVILACLLFSVFIGAWLKQYVSSRYTKIITALLLLLTAFKFLQEAYYE
jgi:uncharacterized membrane protein YfcA